jgi:hypothetical protein
LKLKLHVVYRAGPQQTADVPIFPGYVQHAGDYCDDGKYVYTRLPVEQRHAEQLRREVRREVRRAQVRAACSCFDFGLQPAVASTDATTTLLTTES